MNSPKSKSRAARRREEREGPRRPDPESATAPGRAGRWIVVTLIAVGAISSIAWWTQRTDNPDDGGRAATAQSPADPSTSNPKQPPAKPATPPKAPMIYTCRAVETFPHKPTSYTQGLLFEDGILYEGTGHYGQSVLARVDLRTGEFEQHVALPNQYFGEGIAVWKDTILQLTWKSGEVFVYDKKTLEERERFKIQGEGWGLTHDGKNLILSDGSHVLRYLDPVTRKVTKRLSVLDRGRPVKNLNELEFIEGEIFANVWQTDLIVRISPTDGSVVGWIDCGGLLPPEDRRSYPRPEVLNGIAYEARSKQLYLTGKYWPKLFRVELVEQKPHQPR